jgi:RNA polymerase I-associated factor PAF67
MATASEADNSCVAQVQSILESFIDKSGIRAILCEDGGQKLFETDGFVTDSNVLTMLGYFSLIGLSRLLCLLGRYEDSLRALAPLNPFNRTFLYTFKVPMANINLYYYSGTAYLMLRRYIDAARCFNTILSFIYRVKEQQRCAATSTPSPAAAAVCFATAQAPAAVCLGTAQAPVRQERHRASTAKAARVVSAARSRVESQSGGWVGIRLTAVSRERLCKCDGFCRTHMHCVRWMSRQVVLAHEQAHQTCHCWCAGTRPHIS